MRDHLPDRAVIATGRIGAVGYYSKKRIFDGGRGGGRGPRLCSPHSRSE
ncbi:MAG: hypothetical protein Q8O91_05415 [Candidatus Aminicenantes bacterium]|nr:hypothetical protein [Candidatus Aminicenantes bacterium]